MEDLTLGERKALEQVLTQHGDEDIFVAKLQLGIEGKKKNVAGDRIVLVGRFRIYLFQPGPKECKLSRESHLLEVMEITSTEPTKLLIKTKNFVVTVENGTEKQIEDLLFHLHKAFFHSFPGKVNHYPFKLEPEERLKKLKNSEQEEAYCGGFVNSYQAYCNWLSVPTLPDIVWDINNLFALNDVQEFNLFHFAIREGKLFPADLNTLLLALRDNTWFTSLVVENVKFDKDSIQYIAGVLHHNVALQKVVLKDVGMNKDTFGAICNAFKMNSKLSVTSLDLSQNPIEDKGIVGLAGTIGNFTQGLSSINLSDCKIGSKGISQFLTAMAQHDKTTANLTTLNLTGIRLDLEGSKALSALLAKTSNLKDLDLSQTGTDYHIVKKCESMETLSISGNRIHTKDSKHLELVRFLQLAQNLKNLNISHTAIPSEVFADLIEAVPKLEKLDVSDNGLGDVGLISLVESIKNKETLKELVMDRNIDIKPSKMRGKAVARLSKYLGSEKCHVERLSIAGNAKNQTKADIMPLIFSLMTNKTLRSLDLRGNGIGNTLGLGLGKALQANTSLEELLIDDNSLSQPAFQHLLIGVDRNKVLKCLPVPVIDISNAMKDKTQASLPELMTSIQQKIYRNVMEQSSQPSGQPKKAEAPAEKPEKPTARDVHGQPPQREPPRPPGKGRHMQQKPVGIDTQHASALYGQLHAFLQQSDELTPEEIAEMKLHIKK